jgi:fucose 4-O-acetylase-like acetyltransferase
VIRDSKLDTLRGIGLLCVVLAHVHPPPILRQVRDFDVPLLVLVSGSAFAASASARDGVSYARYLASRFVRLVAPTWLFLSFFFVTALIWSTMRNAPYPFDARAVVSSYFLTRGIDYVWVIRVFLLVSIIAPLTLFARRSRCLLMLSYMVCASAYCGYELTLRLTGQHMATGVERLVQLALFYMVPYGSLFFVGTRLSPERKRPALLASGGALCVFLGVAGVLARRTGHFVPTDLCKYPPTAYYLSYGLAVSAMLYCAIGMGQNCWRPTRHGLAFLGRSSLWLYLWHIEILFLTGGSQLPGGFYVRYVTVLAGAVGALWIQGRVVACMLRRVGRGTQAGNIIARVFSG